MQTQSHSPGKLIVFEGIDGTGKSTQIKLLQEWLTAQGIPSITSFEPTRGQWGTAVRQAAKTQRLPLEQEIDYFLRDRQEHVSQLISPALASGKWVLLDRYYFSMMAYQGMRGADTVALRQANESFAPVPEMAFWLDIPVQTALQRIGTRGALDDFEHTDTLIACRELFASISDPFWIPIDATPPPAAIAQIIQHNIAKMLNS